MESWYKFHKGQAKKHIKFGEYEVEYVRKELHEHTHPQGEKAPVDIDKERIKVLKNGVKMKIRKKDKLAIMEAIKMDNIDRIHEIVSSIKTNTEEPKQVQ